MTVPTRPRALGYVRVSSYLGRDRGEALTEPMQLEKIQQWCAVADLELVEVLRDVDRSGKDFDVRGRPAFEELMRRLEAGEAEAVVVHRMSRFGRDFYETVRTVRRLRERGVVFHSASERVDLGLRRRNLHIACTEGLEVRSERLGHALLDLLTRLARSRRPRRARRSQPVLPLAEGCLLAEPREPLRRRRLVGGHEVGA